MTKEEKIKQIYKELAKNNITLRLEKDGKYIEKKITHRMICALFDLQYMMDDGTWETLKLNKMDKDAQKFFNIVEHFDDAMHGNMIGQYDKRTNDFKWRKKRGDEYNMFGKPEWKKIK